MAVLALATPTAGQQAEAVAVVLRVDGVVELIREVRDSAGAPGLVRRSVRVGHRLQAGDRVEPRGDGNLAVLNRTGQRETIREPVFLEARTEAGGDDLFRRTVDMLDRAGGADTRVTPARVDAVRPRPGVPVPVAPRNGVLIMAAQPRLEWFAVEGAEEYTVRIGAPGEREVRYTAADTSLVLPRALAPGRRYDWRVEVAGRPGPEASLRTISDDEATALVEGLADLRARGFDPDGEGRLLKVVIYTGLELLYGALDELLALEARAGDAGADVVALKGEILARVGRVDEARRALDRARALDDSRRVPPGARTP